MSLYPLLVAVLAWVAATATALAPGRRQRPAALFVAMHVVAVAAITVLVATQTVHWGAVVLPLATLRSVFGAANDWSRDEDDAVARIRGTAIKAPIVGLLWVLGGRSPVQRSRCRRIPNIVSPLTLANANTCSGVSRSSAWSEIIRRQA